MKELREQGLVEKRGGYYCIQDVRQLEESRMEKRAEKLNAESTIHTFRRKERAVLSV